MNKNAQVDLGEFLQVFVTLVEYALKKNYLLDYRCSSCVAFTVYGQLKNFVFMDSLQHDDVWQMFC